MIYRVMKRCIDLLVSAVLLVVLSPLLLAIAWCIRREDGGPAFYNGIRVGRDGVEFPMRKFRTMIVDADRVGGASTSLGDDRQTKIGRRLRAHKLDELPQLINVLRGELSLVGPRPQVPSEVAHYSEEERRLLTVKPGITDWASIKFHDEADILAPFADADAAYNELIRPGKSWLALLYIDQASMQVDFSILRMTAAALIGRTPRVPALPADLPDPHCEPASPT